MYYYSIQNNTMEEYKKEQANIQHKRKLNKFRRKFDPTLCPNLKRKDIPDCFVDKMFLLNHQWKQKISDGSNAIHQIVLGEQFDAKKETGYMIFLNKNIPIPIELFQQHPEEIGTCFSKYDVTKNRDISNYSKIDSSFIGKSMYGGSGPPLSVGKTKCSCRCEENCNCSTKCKCYKECNRIDNAEWGPSLHHNDYVHLCENNDNEKRTQKIFLKASCKKSSKELLKKMKIASTKDNSFRHFLSTDASYRMHLHNVKRNANRIVPDFCRYAKCGIDTIDDNRSYIEDSVQQVRPILANPECQYHTNIILFHKWLDYTNYMRYMRKMRNQPEEYSNYISDKRKEGCYVYYNGMTPFKHFYRDVKNPYKKWNGFSKIGSQIHDLSVTTTLTRNKSRFMSFEPNRTKNNQNIFYGSKIGITSTLFDKNLFSISVKDKKFIVNNN